MSIVLYSTIILACCRSPLIPFNSPPYFAHFAFCNSTAESCLCCLSPARRVKMLSRVRAVSALASRAVKCSSAVVPAMRFSSAASGATSTFSSPKSIPRSLCVSAADRLSRARLPPYDAASPSLELFLSHSSLAVAFLLLCCSRSSLSSCFASRLPSVRPLHRGHCRWQHVPGRAARPDQELAHC